MKKYNEFTYHRGKRGFKVQKRGSEESSEENTGLLEEVVFLRK